MTPEQPDAALQAANLALNGRKMERAASRFASIELREGGGLESSRHHLAWEMAAMAAIGIAALLGVAGLWFI